MVRPFSFLDEETAKQRRKRSQRQEKRYAKKVPKGRAQPASGALPGAKGDVKDFLFLTENKTTKHKSFSISTDLWAEIRQKALLNEGRRPALQIDLENGSASLIVLDMHDHAEMLHQIYQLKEQLHGDGGR